MERLQTLTDRHQELRGAHAAAELRLKSYEQTRPNDLRKAAADGKAPPADEAPAIRQQIADLSAEVAAAHRAIMGEASESFDVSASSTEVVNEEADADIARVAAEAATRLQEAAELLTQLREPMQAKRWAETLRYPVATPHPIEAAVAEIWAEAKNLIPEHRVRRITEPAKAET